MVRLSDLSEADREHLLAKDCSRLEGAPFVTGPPLARRRIAIVTTAGLHLRSDDSFGFRTAEYRVIPSDVATRDIVMSHTSVNFDRTGFQADTNVVFPIDRLRELEQAGAIASLARYHYAFMGAYHAPAAYEAGAREVAGYLREDAVDAVLLVPV
ncbi:MAG: glycine/sarcosine/betaine reductase selenoprotein B family protein [Alphaproteobacteria bacterium]|jgi:D-proline reductase (dithiol) PrdB|nr:glycine/sarcosine/betaine reductase selenoprotein B family protein [Alphaproteobacteria bacterium]